MLHQYELAVFGAYQAEVLARTSKPKSLKHYLDNLKPRRAQTPDEMLAVFRSLKARGAPMKITRTKR